MTQERRRDLAARQFPPAVGLSDRVSGDQRSARRYAYPAHVKIDGRPAFGRDISQTGMAVVVPDPLPVGSVVTVSLGWSPDVGHEISAPARVVRIAPGRWGCVLGLHFRVSEP